jgi:hypothetical protein
MTENNQDLQAQDAGVDLIEQGVSRVIDAIMDGSEAQITTAFDNLATLDGAEVIAELFLWVEDMTEGVDLERLIAVTRIQLPEHPAEIVNAIKARDIPALERVTSTTELTVVVQILFNLIIAFKDARTFL